MITKTRFRKHKTLNKKDRFTDGVKLWTGYYRRNIHRFALDYLGLNLFPFQMILLYMMQMNAYFNFIASRGIGKSYLVAVFIVCKAILYPGIKILVSCETKSQSRALVKEKIEKELMRNSPNLVKEIKEIKTGVNETAVIFKNGSTIEAINASENTRGYRCQCLVIDEYRMIKGGFQTLNQVLKPFLNVRRICKFHSKPEYENYPKEEPQEIYMSSAWYEIKFNNA